MNIEITGLGGLILLVECLGPRFDHRIDQFTRIQP